MKSLFTRLYFRLTVLTLILLTSSSAIANIEISHINEVTHFELLGLTSADYEIEDRGSYIELKVNSTDKSMHKRLSNYSDEFVREIKINDNNALSGFIIRIIKRNPEVKSFDYLTDDPVALSVDIYTDDVSVVRVEKKITKKNKSSKKNNESYYARDPAGSEFIKVDSINGGLLKGSNEKVSTVDFSNIKDETFNILNFDINQVKYRMDSIIESRGKIFLKFPTLLNEDIDIEKSLSKRVSYNIKNKNDAETKRAILLKKVFEAANYKKFLVGKRRFLRKYKKSKFAEMLAYMEADSLYYLYKSGESKKFLHRSLSIYDSVAKKYSGSALAERTILFTSFTRIKNGDYFGAIKNFKYYIDNFKKSPLINQIRLYLAQNLVRIKNHKSAISEFEKLMEGSDEEIRKRSYFNIGDAYFDRKEYRKATRAYNLAIAKYPKDIKNFPNALFNKGEAEFLGENYKESLQAFRSFLKHNPRHKYYPYGLTRIGEIFSIIGDDKKRWRNFYNESYFRHRNSVGAAVAKVHLLSEDVISTDTRRLSILLKEIKENQSKINLSHTDEFITFKISDAFFNRKKYKESTSYLMSFFKNVKIPEYTNKFYHRIGRGISYQIRSFLKENKPFQALQLFENYDGLWFRKSERMDFDLYRAMSSEKAKMYDQAIVEYKQFLKNYEKLPSRDEVEKFENIPPMSEIYMRIANTYAQAGDLKSARLYLSKINKKNSNIYKSDERKKILALLNFKENNFKSAVKNLNSTSGSGVDILNLKIKSLTAMKEYGAAVIEIDRYLNKKNSQDERFSLLKKKAELLSKSSKSNAYYLFLNKFYEEYKETNYDFDEEKYYLGGILISKDKTEEAKSVWSHLNEKSVWKKMANESLKSKKWNSKYDKYIERIPAMAKEKSK